MLAKRVIPCLDVKDGRVVKGRKFQGLQDVADPVALARFYNTSGADELVFYDITASHEGRKLFAETLTAVASQVFIPLTVGGGINDLSDFDRVLKCGADKVSVNSGAVADPTLVGRAAKRYGDQCVVLSIDAKRAGGRFEVYTKGGRVPTGIDAVEWAKRGEAEGAGEIVLNSIDTDGVKRGASPSSPRAAPDARRISSPSLTKWKGWTRGLPPASSTTARWTSALSNAALRRRACPSVCENITDTTSI